MRYNSTKELEKLIRRTVDEELQWSSLENLLMQVDNYNDLFSASRALRRYYNLLKNYYHSKPGACYVALDHEQNNSIYVLSILDKDLFFIVENESFVKLFQIEGGSMGLRLFNAIQYSSSTDDIDVALNIIDEMLVH